MAKTPKVLPALEWLEPRVRLSRIASLICFFALFVLLAVYYLVFPDPHITRPWVILGFELLPWLLLAPGMLTGSPRGHSWTCFLINLYFIKGVVAACDPSRVVFGVLEILASIAVFTSALLYVRWRFQYNRKLAGEGAV